MPERSEIRGNFAFSTPHHVIRDQTKVVGKSRLQTIADLVREEQRGGDEEEEQEVSYRDEDILTGACGHKPYLLG